MLTLRAAQAWHVRTASALPPQERRLPIWAGTEELPALTDCDRALVTRSRRALLLGALDVSPDQIGPKSRELRSPGFVLRHRLSDRSGVVAVPQVRQLVDDYVIYEPHRGLHDAPVGAQPFGCPR